MEKIEVQNRGSQKRLILVVGVVLGVLVLGCTIFLSVFMTKQNEKLEWAAFKGGYPGRHGSMHEETEIDPKRRTMLHVNAEGWRIGINNTVSLHDYPRGLLATRVMETGTCMIIELVDTYEETAALLDQYKRTGVSGERPIREFNSGTLIPQERLVEEIGPRLANFCRGSPTYRLHEVPAGTLGDRKRRSASSFRAVCSANVFNA